MSSPGPPPAVDTLEASKCAWIMARAAASSIKSSLPRRLLVVAARRRQVQRIQLCPHPVERCRVAPAVLVEARVGVDLDDQQRFGRCVVDQIPGNCPNRTPGSLPATDGCAAVAPAACRAHGA